MAVIIKNNKLVIITVPKSTHLDLPKDIGNNFKHEIDFIIKHNKFVAGYTIKNKISRLLPKYKHINDIHELGKQ